MDPGAEPPALQLGETANTGAAWPGDSAVPIGNRKARTAWWSGAGLFLVAAAYFMLGYNLGVNWVDEGDLVYLSWRVSEGAVPNRDFVYVYGPSVFFLNGVLLWWFGPDLHVIRVSLVLVKALVAMLVYLAAHTVASRPFALIAFGLLVATWGTLAVFNTAYANHYTMALNLAGLLLFLRFRDRNGLASFLAGLCFGIAMTFKLTSGLFALAAFVLFQVYHRQSEVVGAPRAFSYGRARGWAVGAVRMLALLGVAALGVAYNVRKNNSLWNGFVLLTPALVSVVVLGWRESRGILSGAERIRSLRGLTLCALGSATILAGYAAFYYAAYGLAGAPLAEQLTLLPQLELLYTIPGLSVRTLLFAAALLGLLASVRFVPSPPGFANAGWHPPGMLVLVGCIVAVLLIVNELPLASVWFPPLPTELWYPDVLRSLFLIPPLVVWASWRAVLLSGRWEQADPSDARRYPPREALALFFFYGVCGLWYLYPLADYWHITMCLPVFLPLLAHVLERVTGATRARAAHAPWVYLRRAVPAAVFVLMAAPFLHSLAVDRLSVPPNPPTFARASHIPAPEDQFRAPLALVEYLQSHVPRERQVFVLGTGRLFYFLAARRSAFDPEYFQIHHVQYYPVEVARQGLPERTIIQRLDTAKPLIILNPHPWVDRFRHTYPAAARYIDAHYTTLQTFRGYRLLEWHH